MSYKLKPLTAGLFCAAASSLTPAFADPLPENVISAPANALKEDGSCSTRLIAEPRSNMISVRMDADDGETLAQTIVGESMPDGSYNYNTIIHYRTNGVRQCASIDISCSDRTNFEEFFKQAASDGSGVSPVTTTIFCPAKNGTYPGNAYWQPPTFAAPWPTTTSRSTFNFSVEAKSLPGLEKAKRLPVTITHGTVTGFVTDFRGLGRRQGPRELVTNVFNFTGTCDRSFQIGIFEDQASGSCMTGPQSWTPLDTKHTVMGKANELN